MSSDIVERLRAVDHTSLEDCFLQSSLFAQAADRIEILETEAQCDKEYMANMRSRIEALQAELAKAREALEPFARVADMEERASPMDSVMVNVSRCRDAREVYRALQQKEREA